LDPNHYKAKVNLAILLEKEGKNQEAHAQYKEANRVKPAEARILQNMGINLKRAGKLDEALTYYKQAVDLEPANSVILYNMGILHNVRSDYEAAIEALQTSIEKNKDNVYAYLALGDALERQKDLKKALSVYKELNALGVKVHGLKEKIGYLETTIAQNDKREKIMQEKEKEKEKQREIKAGQDEARRLKEEARKQALEDDKLRKQKIEDERKAAQQIKQQDAQKAKDAAKAVEREK
jgi:tetratricopeptide (TPR) repeat protein